MFSPVALNKRNFWIFSGKNSLKSSSISVEDLTAIEKSAEEEPENPRKQAALYRVNLLEIIYYYYIILSTNIKYYLFVNNYTVYILSSLNLGFNRNWRTWNGYKEVWGSKVFQGHWVCNSLPVRLVLH